MRISFTSLALGLSLALLGCGSAANSLPETVTAQGIVTLDGKPIDKASVVFIAATGNYHATGTSDSSGRFSLKAFSEKDGAVPGPYKVEVNKTIVTPAGAGGDEESVKVEFGLPTKYATVATSGLTATIPKEGMTNLNLELKSK